ncbi:ABC transporter permease [candidate division WWE3 bacterium]|nr:ABC transporter permease [candidate division WWE3 bacterium]
MQFLETINTALKAIAANKVRSILTMLGVIIGVFAVVTLISLGKGVQNYITDQFNELGSNLLFISPGTGDFGGDPADSFARNKLSEKHIKLIEENVPAIDLISAYYVASENSRFKTNTFLSEIIGVSYVGNKMFNYELEKGRFFTKSEEKNQAKVMVIGPNVAKNLFSNQNAIGERVDLLGDKYEVIGIFKEKGSNFDDQVILPYTSMENTLDLKNFSSIVLKVKNGYESGFVMKQVDLALFQDLDPDEFQVLSQADILKSIQSILQLLTVALSAIAGISLLVGGIGIMNIMLVSVTERIREIGLRKALGATPFNIALQFLVEAVILSVGGGVVGLMFGALATLFAQTFLRAEMTLSAILLAFVFSAGVGIVFGTYPAIKASKKDPIEALRYE